MVLYSLSKPKTLIDPDSTLLIVLLWHLSLSILYHSYLCTLNFYKIELPNHSLRADIVSVFSYFCLLQYITDTLHTITNQYICFEGMNQQVN